MTVAIPEAPTGKRKAALCDAAFARLASAEAREIRDVGDAIRIPANNKLELAIEDVLFRSPGTPCRKPLVRYERFQLTVADALFPLRLATRRSDGDGEVDSGVFNFAGLGVWLFDGDSEVWSQLHEFEVSHLAAANLDGVGGGRADCRLSGLRRVGVWQ